MLNKALLFGLLFFSLSGPSAYAGKVHLEAMIDTYPWLSGSRLVEERQGCFLCHQPRSDEHNWYGQHYFETGWYTGDYSFKTIEHIDSDKDRYTNIEELRALTNPGDPQDFPRPEINHPLGL